MEVWISRLERRLPFLPAAWRQASFRPSGRPFTVYCIKVAFKRRKPELNIEISQEGKSGLALNIQENRHRSRVMPGGLTECLVRPGKVVSDSGCDAHLVMPNQQPVASPWSLPGNCQA